MAEQIKSKKETLIERILSLKEKGQNPITIRIETKRLANNVCWDLARKFGENIGITSRRWGRLTESCYTDNCKAFQYNFDCGSKRATFLFSVEGEPRKTIEELKRESELKQRMEKLIPTSILETIPTANDTAELLPKDIKVSVKLFNPSGAGDWWIYAKDERPNIFWCFANLGNPQLAELGTVSLEELASYKGLFQLGIERDLHYRPETLQEVIDKIK